MTDTPAPLACPWCSRPLRQLAHLPTCYACSSCRESWYAPDGAALPLCSKCVEGIGGAAGGPDHLWRRAQPGEACGASDHLCACHACSEEAAAGWAPGTSARGLCRACDASGCVPGVGSCRFPGAALPTTFHGSISGPPLET